MTHDDVMKKWGRYTKMTPLEWDKYLKGLDKLDKELQSKEARYRFYEWFFELVNTQTREELEQLYGEELPDGINSI